MKRLFSRFRKDRRGNFGQMLAVLSIPLIGVVGLATDLAQASRVRSLLQGAADAAAVGSVAESSPTFKNIGTESGWTLQDARQDALNLFNAYLAGKEGFQVQADAAVTRNGMNIDSKVDYRATVPMRFMRVFGKSSVEVSGEATASVRTATFLDFYMLLDNTPSMGVGATPADIDRMVANTPDKCAFACHETEKSNHYYKLAKSLGVTMRIDVVRQATQELFKTAAQVRKHPNQFRMSVYTFGKAATDLRLTRVVPLTPDMNRARDDAAVVDLMTIPRQGYDNDQQTDYDRTLAGLNAEIANPGTGTGPSDREKYVFFVTDGVGDSYKPTACTKRTTGGRCQEPIDVRACDALKARGIKIAVLYTTYLPLPTNGWYNSWIKPFSDEIAPRMEECASPGLYFQVSPSEGITEAMNKLFLRIVSNPRITG